MASEDSDAACRPNNDTVSLKNLRLSHGIIAPIWGSPKEQPALVSIDLVLRRGFESAAGKDALDENTVHYGTLAKTIRGAGGGKDQTMETFHSMVEDAINSLAMRSDGSCKISYAALTFMFAKASTYGQGASLSTTLAYDEHGTATVVQRDFNLKELRLMVLIGVNDDERNQKQPVIVDFELILGKDTSVSFANLYNELFNIEQRLAKIIEDTTFETLEALANYTVDHLKSEVLGGIPSSKYLRMSFAKPLAVRHADASSVTVFRTLSDAQPSTSSATSGSPPATTLKIIKPYI